MKRFLSVICIIAILFTLFSCDNLGFGSEKPKVPEAENTSDADRNLPLNTDTEAVVSEGEILIKIDRKSRGAIWKNSGYIDSYWIGIYKQDGTPVDLTGKLTSADNQPITINNDKIDVSYFDEGVRISLLSGSYKIHMKAYDDSNKCIYSGSACRDNEEDISVNVTGTSKTVSIRLKLILAILENVEKDNPNNLNIERTEKYIFVADNLTGGERPETYTPPTAASEDFPGLENCAIAGWKGMYTMSGYEGGDAINLDGIEMPLCLTAQWAPSVVTYSFNSSYSETLVTSGQTADLLTQINVPAYKTFTGYDNTSMGILDDATITLTDGDLRRSAGDSTYYFCGWTVNKVYPELTSGNFDEALSELKNSVIVQPGQQYKLTGDTTFYALWVDSGLSNKIFDVTYQWGDGSGENGKAHVYYLKDKITSGVEGENPYYYIKNRPHIANLFPQYNVLPEVKRDAGWNDSTPITIYRTGNSLPDSVMQKYNISIELFTLNNNGSNFGLSDMVTEPGEGVVVKTYPLPESITLKTYDDYLLDTIEGKLFSCWNDGEHTYADGATINLSNYSSHNFINDGPVALKAVWEDPPVLFNFSNNGEEYGSTSWTTVNNSDKAIKSDTLSLPASVTLPTYASMFGSTGYFPLTGGAFQSWKDDYGHTYADGAAITLSNYTESQFPIMLKAVWEMPVVLFNFSNNGTLYEITEHDTTEEQYSNYAIKGLLSNKPVTVSLSNYMSIITDSSFMLEHYNFARWEDEYGNEYGKEDVISLSTYDGKHDFASGPVTLKAVWVNVDVGQLLGMRTVTQDTFLTIKENTNYLNDDYLLNGNITIDELNEPFFDGTFNGKFYGNGYTITVNKGNSSLFSDISTNGSVIDLNIAGDYSDYDNDTQTVKSIFCQINMGFVSDCCFIGNKINDNIKCIFGGYAYSDLSDVPDFSYDNCRIPDISGLTDNDKYMYVVGSGYTKVSIPTMFVASGNLTVSGNAGTNPSDPFYSAGTTPVTVNLFSIGEKEVSRAQWNEVMLWALDNGYMFSNTDVSWDNPNIPITSISLCDAILWCNALSEKCGFLTYYTDSLGNAIKSLTSSGISAVRKNIAGSPGYRLPTKTEWLFAARGGDPNKPAWSASTGNQNISNANFGGTLLAVNRENLVADSNGLQDMLGNAAEWSFDPALSSSGSYSYDIQGGSASYEITDISSSYSSKPDVDGSNEFIGFRVARDQETGGAISSEDDLLSMELSRKYFLIKDIRLSSRWISSLSKYQGTFYGNGHTITFEEGASAPLIDSLTGEIYDLVIDGNFNNASGSSIFCNTVQGVIKNCHFAGELNNNVNVDPDMCIFGTPASGYEQYFANKFINCTKECTVTANRFKNTDVVQ